MLITFELKGKVVPKGRPRFYRGHAITPPQTVEYEKKVKEVAQAVMGTRPPFDEPAKVYVKALMPIPKSWSKKKRMAAVGTPHLNKPDVDNLLKAVMDAMNGVVYVDDSVVYSETCEKFYDDEPRAIVVIEIYEGGTNDGNRNTQR